MPTAAKKKWTVHPNGSEAVIIEAERLSLDDARVRATFYDGDEVVASFTGFQNIYPVQESK